MCAAGRSEEIAEDGIVKGHAFSLTSAKDVTIPLILYISTGDGSRMNTGGSG